jgi:hypothetical protein
MDIVFDFHSLVSFYLESLSVSVSGDKSGDDCNLSFLRVGFRFDCPVKDPLLMYLYKHIKAKTVRQDNLYSVITIRMGTNQGSFLQG